MAMLTVCGVPQLTLLLLVAAPLMGQNSAIPAGSGRIQGTVFDENGRPLAKTTVIANRTLLPFSITTPWGDVLNQKLWICAVQGFNRNRTRAASYGRDSVGALCPSFSMTSAAAMY